MPEELEFVPLTIEEMQELFPQYEIITFIAAGGMGSVYYAVQKSIERDVAIKVLPRELSADEEFNRQFRAEAKVMAKVNHPNVVSLFDFGEVEDMLFIIMEFVDGKSLFHSAHGVAISPEVALEIVMGLCKGIAHAHENGILHRDVKPGNILLDPKANPKIGDFGLARPVEDSEVGKVIYGTPGYTAPEVINNPEVIDERSDIFSIGVILYELLIGHLPDQDNYKPPSTLQPVPKILDRIVLQAIANDPDYRYTDTNSLLEDLKKVNLEEEKKQKVAAPAAEKPAAPPQESVAAPRQIATPKLKTGKTLVTSTAAQTSKADVSVSTPALPAKATASSNNQQLVEANQKRKKAAKAYKIVGFLCALIIAGLVTFTILTNDRNNNKAQPSDITEAQSPIPTAPDTVDSTPEEIHVDRMLILSELRNDLLKGKFEKLPPNTVVINNRAYFYVEDDENWLNAQRNAERHGGYLACPSNDKILDALVDQMKVHKASSVWTGGGTTGELTFSWIDGKKWANTRLKSDEFAFVALSAGGSLSSVTPEKLKTYFICWDLKGFQLGSSSSQIDRVTNAASLNKTDNLPPMSYVTEKDINLLIVKRMMHGQAKRKANNVNASLSLPLNGEAINKMNGIITNVLPNASSVWLRGDITPGGEIKWDTKSEVNITQWWIEEVKPHEKERGVIITHGKDEGLKPRDKFTAAEGAFYSWEINK